MSEKNPSSEYNALLLSMLTEMRDDQGSFRLRVETKLDQNSIEVRQVLVRLAEGTGRMDTMAATMSIIEAQGEDNGRRIRSIESGSGMHSAITNARLPLQADEKGNGGWISVDKLPAIITSIGALLAIIMSSIAMFRPNSQPQPVQISQPASGHVP